MRYLLELVRYSDSGDNIVLTKREITADEAIQLIIDSNHSQGDAPDFKFAVEEDEVAVEEKKKPEQTPKRKKYVKPADATEPIERLAKAGGRACGKCGQTGHNARSCSGPKTGEGLTEYERRKQEKEAELADEDPTLAEVAKMAAEGLSQAELQMMFPSVPMYEIIKAWERHNHV